MVEKERKQRNEGESYLQVLLNERYQKIHLGQLQQPPGRNPGRASVSREFHSHSEESTLADISAHE